MSKLNLDINMKFFDNDNAVKTLQSLSSNGKKLSNYLISAEKQAKELDKTKIAKHLKISLIDLDSAIAELLKVKIAKKL